MPPNDIPNWPFEIFGPARFAKYLDFAEQDHARALALYRHNLAVSSALFELIALVEVGLRNRIILALESRGDRWVDVLESQLDGVKSEKFQLQRRKAARHPTSYNHDNFVTHLSFGFWVGLFSHQLENRIWSRYLHRINRQQPEARTRIHRKLERVKQLRNRIAHHETILDLDLDEEALLLRDVASWLSLDLAEFLCQHSRVQQLLDLTI